MFTSFLKVLEEQAAKAGRTLIVTCLTLAFTDASARAVPLRKLPRWLERIDLSFTRTSPRGPRFLASFPNLRVLHLDHCPTLKAEKDLFKKLMDGEKFATLEELSLVGVSNALSPDWLEEVQQHAPALRVVYFTRAPGTKALGWTDAVLMQTMREPVLLPCGHIMEKEAALKGKLSCAFCRARFHGAVRGSRCVQ